LREDGRIETRVDADTPVMAQDEFRGAGAGRDLAMAVGVDALRSDLNPEECERD